MPTDIAQIVASLESFYDFRGKTVVHVGAGGGQMIGYAGSSRKVLAVDRDVSAIRRLDQRVAELALERKVSAVTGDFCDLDLGGDVVLFEFCLHEMREPGVAIDHARARAPDVVVIDHLPESPWAWYAHEEEEMARAWAAVEAAGTRKRQQCPAVQRFETFAELRARFSAQDEESHRRIGGLPEETAIAIPMPYGIALL